MSTSSPQTLSHSKHWIRDPKASPIILVAKPSPGQPLLPAPNGKYMNPSLFPSGPWNLSGLNFVGSSHKLGSLCTDRIFTKSMVPRGTRKPPTVHSSDDSWGGRVHSESLVDDALEIGKLEKVWFFNELAWTNNGINFDLGLHQGLWIVQQEWQCPLHGPSWGVRPRR